MTKKNKGFERTCRRFGSSPPKKFIKYFDEKLKVSGIQEETRVWLGKRVMITVCFGLIMLLSYLVAYNPIATPETISISIVLFISGTVIVSFLSYLHLYFKIANRTSAVEKVLPDYLMLTVSNLMAGMSPFNAFIKAARPEFGALYDEIELNVAKAGGKTSLVAVIKEISDKFDSQIFKRTTNLFVKGIKSGGQLAKLLHSSADEVRHIQDLRTELVTATRTYTIFLGFIIVVIMPFLLAVSTHFLTMFSTIQAESSAGLDTAILGNAPTMAGKIRITPDEMVNMSMVTLAITSLLVSSLMGIIGRGRALYGVKYFPILLIASIIFFILARTVVASMLSGFIGA
jgi:Flp pilus assembly protein TadB